MRNAVLAAIATLAPCHARTLQDVDVALDEPLQAGTPATLYVAVAGSTGFDATRPEPSAEIRVSLDGRVLAEGRAGPDGAYVAEIGIPDGAEGQVELAVDTRSAFGEERVRRRVEVQRRRMLTLRTDRTLYGAGDTLHWRALVLNAADAHPRGDAEVEVKLVDERGTQLWRGRAKTNGTGMVAGAVPLGRELALGEYRVTAAHGRWSDTRKITLRAIELPDFFVDIREEDGGLVVAARQPYGEPVEGYARVEADGRLLVRDALDGFGRLELGARRWREVRAVVTDGAERAVSASWSDPRHVGSLDLAAVPSPGALTLVTARGERLVPSWVRVGDGPPLRSSGGALRLELKPGHYEVEARADGERVAAVVDVPARPARFAEVERAVVGPGEPVRVRGRWEGARQLVATLLRYDGPIASAPVRPGPDGRFMVDLRPPAGAHGLAEIRVAETAWRAGAGVVGASVYLEPAQLSVSVRAGTRQRPGETAAFGVEVRDGEGRPVPGAGLAASVIDERALALEPARPDLVEILQGVDLANASAAGLAFVALLGGGPSERLAARALVERLPARPPRPWLHHTAQGRWDAEVKRLGALVDAVDEALAREPGGLVRYHHGARMVSRRLAPRLPVDRRLTPWGEPTDWSYAERIDPRYAVDAVLDRVARKRLSGLGEHLGKGRMRAVLGGRFAAALAAAPAHLRRDPWGSRHRLRLRRVKGVRVVDLVSLGPDRHFGTGDDLEERDVFGTDPSPVVAYGYGGLGSRGFGRGGGGMAYGRSGVARVKAAPVRARFDETVLWVAGVPTGADGSATLEVRLADSITGWRVQVEALSKDGAVGIGEGRLETFLPLQVDARVPDELTTGDRVVLRAVVANHSGEEKRLTVRGSGTGAVRAASEATLEVPDGATAAVDVPLTAVAAGAGEVALALLDGDTVVDRVERPTRVVAPGHLVRVLNTGALRNGVASFDLEVPPDVAANTIEGQLRLYRGPADQALDGLEGMLREPHGCFEQTSSSNYPNLLVLRLLKDDPEVRGRALELLHKGYQRLVSYEVSGGGFSWFGEAPANRVLTAYGLMQFVDMAEVFPVDPALVERTRRWLASQQQVDGSFTPDASWLHDWSAVQGPVATTSYIAWALAEAGERGETLRNALGFLRRSREALVGKPYLLALWAAAEARGARGATTASARAVSSAADTLALLRKDAERLDGGLRFGASGQTLFYASGRAADAQVTAVAIHALTEAGDLDDAADALSWLWSARAPNHGWGSTQGTVLALRAAARAAGNAPKEGRLSVRLDGQPLGEVDLGRAELPTVRLPSALGPGTHRLEVAGDVGGRVLTDLRAAWRKRGAPTPEVNGIEVGLAGPAEPLAVG